MALINCPECNKQISDTASKCKDCGFPINNNNTHQKKKMSGRIISKKWIGLHSLISFVLAIGIGLPIFFNGNDVASGIFIFFITAVIYWLILFLVFTVIKLYRKKEISKGWVRLHVLISITILPILCGFGSDWDDVFWGVYLLFFVIYWVLIPIIYWVIKGFKEDSESSLN